RRRCSSGRRRSRWQTASGARSSGSRARSPRTSRRSTTCRQGVLAGREAEIVVLLGERGRRDGAVEVAFERELPFLDQPDRLVVVRLPSDVEPEAVVLERPNGGVRAKRVPHEVREVEVPLPRNQVERGRLEHVDAHAHREVELRLLSESDYL